MNDHAADIYQPRPLAARLTLFKPQVNYKFYPDPKMGWGDLALGGLDVVELPVNPHAMLMEPFVLELATQLKARIDACGGSPRATRPNGARPKGERLTASVAAA